MLPIMSEDVNVVNCLWRCGLTVAIIISIILKKTKMRSSEFFSLYGLTFVESILYNTYNIVELIVVLCKWFVL